MPIRACGLPCRCWVAAQGGQALNIDPLPIAGGAQCNWKTNAIEVLDRIGRGDERFLRDIEGFLSVACRRARKPVHGLTVAFDQCTLRAGIASPCSAYQRRIRIVRAHCG